MSPNENLDAKPPFLQADAPFFNARLTPYRSLSPKGFLILMGVTGAICFFSGLMFLSLGAWPIFGFFGLDVALVWWAFRSNYRTARAYEEVMISATQILIRKVSHRGAVEEIRFNPFWVKLEINREEDEGVTKITLNARGKRTLIGGFLNPDDRTSFASALQSALNAAKTGGAAPSMP